MHSSISRDMPHCLSITCLHCQHCPLFLLIGPLALLGLVSFLLSPLMPPPASRLPPRCAFYLLLVPNLWHNPRPFCGGCIM
jgi:hypothetical protein